LGRTHWRTSRRGNTWSRRCAAASAMRRVLHEGQTPRPLQEKATKKSAPQLSQRTRAKPWARVPHSRYLRKRSFGEAKSLLYISGRGVVVALAVELAGTGRHWPALARSRSARLPCGTARCTRRGGGCRLWWVSWLQQADGVAVHGCSQAGAGVNASVIGGAGLAWGGASSARDWHSHCICVSVQLCAASDCLCGLLGVVRPLWWLDGSQASSTICAPTSSTRQAENHDARTHVPHWLRVSCALNTGSMNP
jgi:hypothetical protein